MADSENQESQISALDMYWVNDHPELMHIPARVVSREEKTIKVETIEGNMMFIEELQEYLINAFSDDIYEKIIKKQLR